MKSHRLLKLALSICLLAGTMVAVTTENASAATATCGKAYVHVGKPTQTVQNCPIWMNNTPVFDNVQLAAPYQIGTLIHAGNGNYFVCQFTSYKYTYKGYSSTNWAVTVADNGAGGVVPAVYFGGSQNYWAGLRHC